MRITMGLTLALILVIAQGGRLLSYGGEIRQAGEEHLKTQPQPEPLDEEWRVQTQGTTVALKFAGTTSGGELVFNFQIDNPSLKISHVNLDQRSILGNDKGIEVRALRWELVFLTATYALGTLYFPPRDSAGNLLIEPRVREVTLKILDLYGIAERRFQWTPVPPVYSGTE